MGHLCEACETAKAVTVESCDDPSEPYHLCAECHRRLHARALRPKEWYNLAKRHGWYQFLLHDDFYDEDGIADQPEEAVECPNDFPAPSLADVTGNARALLDFSITRWRLQEDNLAAWLTLPPDDVAVALSERFATTTNVGIRATVLEICALTLRERAEELVRYAWGEYPDKANLASLAQASAACLPFREGFDRVLSAVCSLEGARKRDAAFCLSYFHSTEVLDWMEQNIFEPITESWGYLAAASKIDWARIESWFTSGRPLSLVAIDALLAIANPQTPFLRAYKPRLTHPPKPEQFKKVVTDYAMKDRVPRVQQRIEVLLGFTTSFTPNGNA